MGEKFRFGPSIRAEIVEGLRHSRRRDVAVAYVGQGAAKLFPANTAKTRLMCDLFSPGTNPEAVRQLQSIGVEVKRLDGLHAKVYLFDAFAVVGSANASLNALGDGGKMGPRLREAAYAATDVADLNAISLWFEELWNATARVVTDDDINAAIFARKMREMGEDRQRDEQPPLIEVINTVISNEEWEEISGHQAPVPSDTVWVWPNDRSAFVHLPRRVLSLQIANWRGSATVDEFYGVDVVQRNVFELKGAQIGLGRRYQSSWRRPRWWNEKLFFDALRGDSEVSGILGLERTGVAGGFCRTAWFRDQTTEQGAIAMRAFWKRAGWPG